MREWIDRLTAAEHVTQKAFVLFNNCHHAQAAANARRFKQLLQSLAGSLEIVEPFASVLREKTLFD